MTSNNDDKEAKSESCTNYSGENNSPKISPYLSKSWIKVSSHFPLYSGGKITVCHRQEDPFLLAQNDGAISIINAMKGISIGTVKGSGIIDDDIERSDHEAITSFCLSPNDVTLITAHRNLLLKIADLSIFINGKVDNKLSRYSIETLGRSGHDLPIYHMSFHPSGKFFATGSVDSRVSIWDCQTRYITHTFRHSRKVISGGGLKGSVTSLHWCQNLMKLWLSIGREDGSIHIHDLKTNSIVTIVDHMGAVSCVNWNKECDVFLTAGRDEVVHTYHVLDDNHTQRSDNMMRKDSFARIIYKRVHTLPIYESITSLQILPDLSIYSNYFLKSNIYLVTSGSKGVVRIWRTSKKKKIISKLILVKKQEDTTLFGDENGGYTGSHLINWESKDKNFPHLLVVDSEQNFTFLNLCHEESNLLEPTRTIVGNNGEIIDIKIIPHDKAKLIAVATNSINIKLFDLDKYNCQTMVGHTGIILCLAVSPCGRYLVTCSKDKTIRLWNIYTHKCLAIGEGHSDSISTLALSQKKGKYEVGGACAMKGKGAFVISGSKDRTIKRWNLPGTGVLDGNKNEDKLLELKAVLTKLSHEKDINVVTVAPNDAFICTGSQDKTAKLWHASDLSLAGTLSGHKRSLWDCKFSDQHPVVATSSGDLTVKLWSVADKICLRTFQGHSGTVLRVLFLQNGLQLFSSGGDGLIKLWTIRTNECEMTLDGHGDRVWAMDVSSDGQMLCTASADGKIIVWKDSTIQDEEAERLEQERNILMEQRLANHLRKNEYKLALDMSLSMFKPMQTFKVLVMIIENHRTLGDDYQDILIGYVKSWSIYRIVQVLRYCRDWNTMARNCDVAMLMLRAIIVSIPAETLASEDGVKELMDGIMPYAERHYDRIDGLKTDSYIIDYFLKTMEVMDKVDDLS